MNPLITRLAFYKTASRLLLGLGFIALLFFVTREPDPEPRHLPKFQAPKSQPDTADAIKKPLVVSAAKESDAAGATKRQIAQGFGRLPLEFEKNQGQADREVQFLSRGDGYSLFLTAKEAVLSVRSRPKIAPPSRIDHAIVRMQFVNANASPRIEGSDQRSGKSNYFIGNDPAKWQSNVAHYGRVQYQNVWPGIDVVYYGNQRNLEYDFVVSPGSDPSRIRVKFAGSKGISLSDHGDLRLKVPGGELEAHLPRIYQPTATGRRQLKGHYSISRGDEVSFVVEDYNHSAPLVIDPILSYSTYLGGSGSDAGTSIAVDASGSAYITGYTDSANFPTVNPIPSSQGTGIDVFVTKLNPAGTALVYSTYLGGSGTDEGTGIAVDSTGDAFVTGFTSSDDFPQTGSLQSDVGGSQDAFLAKLSPAGSTLISSVELGGESDDGSVTSANGIALDATGNAYLTGSTNSSNFPIFGFPIQSSYAGPQNTGFIAEIAFGQPFSPGGPQNTSFVFSTYYGGDGSHGATGAQSIAIDPSLNIYITGYTSATDFQLANPIQEALGSVQDAFVAKLEPFQSGSIVLYYNQLYSTYLGGNADDSGLGIAADATGNAYVTGLTFSSNFPLLNPLQSTLATSGESGFVAKINSQGTALTYSTYLGSYQGTGIAADANGNAYVIGSTFGGLPLASPIQSSCAKQVSPCAFVTVIPSTGLITNFSTYFGGSGYDTGSAIAIDSSTNIYLTGSTTSTDFPLKNALQPTYGGADSQSNLGDAFVAKINNTPTTAVLSVTPPQLIFTSTYNAPAPPAQTLTVSLTGVFGVSVPFTVVATTTMPPNVDWLTATPAPPSATPGTITVTVNPAGLSPGTYPGQITISSPDSSIRPQVVNVTYTISVASPVLQITSGCPVSPVVQNSLVNQALFATGGNGTYSWSIVGTLPASLSLNGSTISGTVTAAPGIHTFGINVGSGQQTTGVDCSLTVTPPKLQITSVCPGNGTLGAAYGPFTLSATGGLVASPGASSYQFSIIGSLPAGIGLNGNVISGTPTVAGTSTFTIQVTSGTQTATAGPCSVTIVSALTITGTCPVEAQVGVPISVPISASGGVPPYTFKFSGSNGLSFSNGTVSGTITTVETASFTVIVNDNANSPPATKSCSFAVTKPVQIVGTCPVSPIAEGQAFSVPLAGSGGTPPYGWSVITGPSWLSISGTNGAAISVTGTPPSAGSFQFSVSLTDSAGLSATPFSCTLTVEAALKITSSAACPASPLTFQSAVSLSFTASNGTAPYSWAYSGPAWLSLSTTSGIKTTLSGTASVAGTFPIKLTLTDSANSTPATFSCTIIVSQPVIPPVTVTGSNPTQAAISVTPGLSLADPAPVTLTGTVTLTFTPNVTTPLADSSEYTMVTFSDPCGQTCTFTIPAGDTTPTPALPAIQVGTVAGTIHVVITSLSDGSGSVLPTNAPSKDLTVPPLAPVLLSGCYANQTNSGYDILIMGYSTPRDMTSSTVTFTAAAGATIQGPTTFNPPVSGQFTTFYGQSISTSGGSTFKYLTIPVTLSGNSSAIAGVTVTLTNSAGTSQPLPIAGTCSQ